MVRLRLRLRRAKHAGHGVALGGVLLLRLRGKLGVLQREHLHGVLHLLRRSARTVGPRIARTLSRRGSRGVGRR